MIGAISAANVTARFVCGAAVPTVGAASTATPARDATVPTDITASAHANGLTSGISLIALIAPPRLFKWTSGNRSPPLEDTATPELRAVSPRTA
jgi:hypothetical protein